ncbi:PilZ domain-containing protein [Sphingomonas sp.]|uniref:PilZ domain-containing protein n=1 Tax=Sphingomonas sp. TaxID=28214 RepID=UPI0017A9C107|nr:PilZ domain-containing protein [Sphingomonas sp.]MBA3510752.1 PilZ domain-containing protein [Sphingomonas sp.]
MQQNTSHGGVEARSAARTNLFLAATLHSADVAHPVIIRDLSATGARIETSLMTQAGDSVTLVRGGLSVDARITWQAERFCGLSFTSPVSIPAWMTNPVLLQGKRGRSRAAVDGELATPVHPEAGSGSVADELARISRSLGTVGQMLAHDPAVLLKHGSQLFSLGRAARTLAALAETMQDDAPQAPARTARPDELGA